LYGKGYRDIWVLPSNVWSGELPIINEDGNFYGYVKRFDEIMPTLYHATYSVSDHCNLKCKRCAYFSNLVNETVFADLDEFKEDLLGLKRRFFNVESFVLVGGEPFLNPDIDGFIYAVREAFPYSRLTIITNGLLLPSLAPKVIKAIRTCGVLVRISQYPPTRKMVDKILKFGWDNNIEILILNPINKFEQTVSYQNTDYVKAWENCTSNRCYHLRGHRLYNCPQIVYRYENREFLDLDTSEALRNQCSVDIVNGNENGWEILQKICNPVELCRYCPAEVKLADWESTERNKPIDKMDWVADD
jgi:organic radical activating enzyme